MASIYPQEGRKSEPKLRENNIYLGQSMHILLKIIFKANFSVARNMLCELIKFSKGFFLVLLGLKI